MLQIQIDNQVFQVSGLINVTPVTPPPTAFDIDDDSTLGAIRLEWTDSPGNDTEVYRSDGGAPFVLIATVPPATGFYEDNAAFTDPYTEYKIRAVGVNGPSAYTDPRGVGESIGNVVTADYSYPFMVLHFNSASLTDADVINFPLLRKIIDGGLSLQAGTATSANFDSLYFSGTTIYIATPSLTSIAFPSLITMVDGDFIVQGNSDIVTVSAPLLTSVPIALTLESNPLLANVDLSSVASVGTDAIFFACPALNQLNLHALGTVNGLILDTVNSLTNLDLDNLTLVNGSFTLTGALNLTPLDLPALQDVFGDVLIDSCAAFTMDFTSLQTTGSLSITNCPEVTALSFPAFVTGNSIILTGNTVLQTLSMPLLFNPGGDVNFSSNPALTSVDFTSLQTVGGFFNGGGCTSLVTLDLPALVTVASDFSMSGCNSLVNFSAPNWLPTDSTTVEFTGDSLAVGDAGTGVGVDGILRRCNTTPMTSGNIELASGSNASPTGGVANADYVALTTAGVTVNIN